MSRGAPLLLLVLAGVARAQAPAEPRTLERQDGAVTVQGELLGQALGAPIGRLRLYALHDGALRPIPYQVDERTSVGAWAFDRGEERRSDSDDAQLDGNDELAFMVRDLGARLAPGAPPLQGEAARTELTVSSADGAARGWAYLLRFADAAPPRADADLVALGWSAGDLEGWATPRARVRLAPSGTNVLDVRELRFARPSGEYGPDVLDRAKASLKGRYLFLDIARREDEMRAQVGAYIDGPVRVIARLVAETYLIWGHWVRATPRSQLVIYEDRLELDLEVRLPVAFEPDSRSELRLGLDFSPEAGDLALWTDLTPLPLRPGRARRPGEPAAPAQAPAWICVSGAEGSLLLRIEQGPAPDQVIPRALSVLDGPAPDPPEDVPGSYLSAGVTFDLTGLVPASYRLRVTLQLGPPVQPGGEARLLAPEAAPLRVEAR